MRIDFVPTTPVALSLGFAVLLPVCLLVLSHGACKVAAPGRRFVLAAAVVWAGWFTVMGVTAPGAVDLLTGGLLLATATLVGFTLWTLVAWGFTVAMLLALQRANRPLGVEEWTLALTRGKPLDAFARDRLGVLLKLGLAELRGDGVVMTAGRGRLFARATALLRTLFGLPK